MTAALCIRKRGSRPAAAAVERGIAGELTSGVAAGGQGTPQRRQAALGRTIPPAKPWPQRNGSQLYAGESRLGRAPEEGGLFWDHDRPAAASKGGRSGAVFHIPHMDGS